MPAILNCLDEENTCKVGGSHFTFKANQIKYFHDPGVANVIARIKAEDGFILLPQEVEHLAHLKEDMLKKVMTPEESVIIAEKRKEGLHTYCRRLRELHYNATVSLQKDIDRAGYKYDARVEATRADLDRIKKLAKYQSDNLDLDQNKIAEFKELEKKVIPTAKG